MADVQALIDELTEHIDRAACDDALTKMESIEVYEALASHCAGWARTIESEL